LNWLLNVNFSPIDFIGFLIPNVNFMFTDLVYHGIDLSVSSEPMELAKRRSPLHSRDYSHVMKCRDPVTVNAKLSSKFPINCSRTCRVNLQNAMQNVYSRWPVARQVCTQSRQHEKSLFSCNEFHAESINWQATIYWIYRGI